MANFESISKKVQALEKQKMELESEYLENLKHWINSNVMEPYKSKLIKALSGKGRRGRPKGSTNKPKTAAKK